MKQILVQVGRRLGERGILHAREMHDGAVGVARDDTVAEPLLAHGARPLRGDGHIALTVLE